jgi:hypothetical protein
LPRLAPMLPVKERKKEEGRKGDRREEFMVSKNE